MISQVSFKAKGSRRKKRGKCSKSANHQRRRRCPGANFLAFCLPGMCKWERKSVMMMQAARRGLAKGGERVKMAVPIVFCHLWGSENSTYQCCLPFFLPWKEEGKRSFPPLAVRTYLQISKIGNQVSHMEEIPCHVTNHRLSALGHSPLLELDCWTEPARWCNTGQVPQS